MYDIDNKHSSKKRAIGDVPPLSDEKKSSQQKITKIGGMTKQLLIMPREKTCVDCWQRAHVGQKVGGAFFQPMKRRVRRQEQTIEQTISNIRHIILARKKKKTTDGCQNQSNIIPLTR